MKNKKLKFMRSTKLCIYLMSLTVSFGLLTGCGNTDAATDSDTVAEASSENNVTVAFNGQTYTGKITEITDSTITLALGSYSDESDSTSFTENGDHITFEITNALTISMGSDSQDSMQTPPEKPDGDGQGEMNQGDAGQGSDSQDSMQTPPEKPDGDGQGEMNQGDAGQGSDSQDSMQTPPEKPDGNGQGEMNQGDAGQGNGMGQAMTLSVSDLAEDDIITVEFDDDGIATTITILSGNSMQGGAPDGAQGGMPGGAPGSSAADISYSALESYAEDSTIFGENIASTGSDENAVLVTDGEVSIENTKITRDSSDSTGGDNASFYGVGAAVLTTGGNVSVTDCEITTDAAGGAGVFAYGDGTATVTNTTIATTQDTSGGIHVAGGGTLNAYDTTVTTDGNSSAAIRSDRGGGTMNVEGGSYTSNGTGSPAIYSTADITVKEADLTANNSEAICIEGSNSIALTDCNLTGNMKDDSQNDCTWNVILYQSMSGDSEVGNSTFTMEGGTLTAGNGGMFYTTNTESTFTLKNVDIIPSDSNDFLLRCTGNSNARGWGSTGSNGADCLFTAICQELTGDVIWDSISNLDFYLTDQSTLEGAFLDDESCAGNGGDGTANLYLSEDSTWIVTGDSVLSSLYAAGTIEDEDGNPVSIVDADGTVLSEGTSSYTITVDNYSETCDLSGAGSL